MDSKTSPWQSFTTHDAILLIPPTAQQQSHQKGSVTNQDNACINSGCKDRIPILFFFLTGNPGLISYYREYLDLLAQTSVSTRSSSLEKKPLQDEFIFAGFSLGGFEVENREEYRGDEDEDDSEDADEGSKARQQQQEIRKFMFPPSPFYKSERELYGLTDQIELCHARLRYLCQRITDHYCPCQSQKIHGNKEYTGDILPPVKVIIAGHSVGAYIALELVRLHHEEFVHRRGGRRSNVSSSSSTKKRSDPNPNPNPELPEEQEGEDFQIVSSILLTPTIIEIANSRLGRVAAPILSNIPLFPSLIQFLSRGMTTLLSRNSLTWIVHKVTGMKLGGLGLGITVAFLMSRNGVRQALHMARDELRDMTANKWGDEVWGSSRIASKVNEVVRSDPTETGEISGWKAPKLFFLFAREDHWIANSTRDGLIRELREMAKGRQAANGQDVGVGSEEPTVIIDEESGLVHAWCLEQTKFVAEFTRTWIANSLSVP